MKQDRNQSGSVIYWIFIAIALFAALGFAVSHIARGGGEGGTNELTKSRATDMLQYAGAVQRGVRLMLMNGSAETELCFHAVSWGHTDYEFNPPCADNANRVFHPDGGAIGFQETVDRWYDEGIAIPDGGQWVFSARYEVTNVGTDGGTADSEDANTDLLMITAPVADTLCETINRMLGHDPATPPAVQADTYSDLRANKFQGAYTGEAAGKIGDFGRERCVQVPAAPSFNMYYKVILAR